MNRTYRPLFAVAVLLALLPSIVGPIGVTYAHFWTGNYIYSDSSGTQQKDPANVTFYSRYPYDPSEPPGYASHVETIRHIEHHFNWRDNNGSNMWFSDHDSFHLRDDQRNNCFLCSSQYHVRVKQGIDADDQWGVYTAVAAHVDEYRWCLHVATDFDGPRDVIQRGMNDQNPTDHPDRDYYAFNGNTAPSPQCDGSMPRSYDGNTAWQKMGVFW